MQVQFWEKGATLHVVVSGERDDANCADLERLVQSQITVRVLTERG